MDYVKHWLAKPHQMEPQILKWQEKYPDLVELDSVKQQVTTARAIVQAADTLLLQKELSRRQEELLLVETLLPDKEDLAILVNKVSRLGNLAGVNFALLEPQAPIQHQIYQERPYKVTLRGGFHQTARFLAELAGLDQIVRPSGVNITRDTREEAGPSETLTAEFTMTTYLMIPATEQSPAEGGQNK